MHEHPICSGQAQLQDNPKAHSRTPVCAGGASRFKEPIPQAVIDAAEAACQRLVDAGGLVASLIQEDDTHATLVLTFPDLETEERIKSEIGGPWMKEHVVPLLAGPPDRSSGAVVAGTL